MPTTEEIKLGELRFDYDNPRLVESGVNKRMSEDDLVKILCETMAVDEIILSMVKSGYFQNDPLIAIKEKGHYTVIEGNRRLAALKVITQYEKFKEYYPSSLSKPTRVVISRLETIPVFVETSRKDSWQYIGFKHVNGAAKWSSFAKAEYISKVHNDFNVSLDEIALQIGDSNKTVEKLYQALMVIEQAEKNEIFDRGDIYHSKLYFSHLYTGLQYDGIRTFIGLKELSDTPKPVEERKMKSLRDVLLWIFGSKKEDTRPVIVSQNPDLRNLDQVLKHSHSVQILRSTGDLNLALESSEPDENKFYESLTNSKLELYRALQFVATGYKGDEEQLKTAGTISEMAENLYDTMDSKHNSKRQVRKRKPKIKEE